MRNLKVVLRYNGAHFYGWQKQKNLRTVQGDLEDAIFAITGEKVEVFGSGRTDKGVHALGQVASFNLNTNIPLKNLKIALNDRLEKDVRVMNILLAKEDFHARFSAKVKTYEYVVQVGGISDAIKSELMAYFPYDVDLDKMQKAAKMLVGKHKFKGFCAADTQVTSFEREIFDISIKKSGRIYKFSVTGNGFLYNMVRIIVGTLLDVGRGALSFDDVKKALSGERKHAGQTMPACGLYLKSVKYSA